MSWHNGSTALINPRKQNEKLRPHLNTKDLNAAIQIEHIDALFLEEILLNLKDAKVFSIREKKCEYRNVVPGKESITPTTGSGACPLASKCLKRSSRLRWTRHLKANG